MKFIHLSDLHIGKRIKEYSLIEDQKYILKEILGIVKDEKPNAVLIAGDVYDKSIASTEAVSLLDDFVIRLHELVKNVFIISGNHDSSERLAFGSRLMQSQGVYISPVYNGKVEPTVLEDEFGKVNIYMLPFIKPAHVRAAFPDEEIDSYTSAVRTAINNMNIDENDRNVLITHQFVTGASRSDSEEFSVGGTDNIDASVFDCFDYVALGHIHSPQKIGRETVRYCGTPLKYSMSEANQQKSVSVVEFNKKDDITVRTVDLTPMHDMREIRGTYDELMNKKNYESTATDDYIHVVLTDEEDVPDAISKLRTVYPNILDIEYDNKRTRSRSTITEAVDVEQKTPYELFMEFYEKQNGQQLSDEQSSYTMSLIEELEEGK